MKVEPWFGSGLNQLFAAAASPCWLSALSSILPSWVPQNKRVVNPWNHPKPFQTWREKGSGSLWYQVCTHWRLTGRSEARIKYKTAVVELVEMWDSGQRLSVMDASTYRPSSWWLVCLPPCCPKSTWCARWNMVKEVGSIFVNVSKIQSVEHIKRISLVRFSYCQQIPWTDQDQQWIHATNNVLLEQQKPVILFLYAAELQCCPKSITVNMGIEVYFESTKTAAILTKVPNVY